MTGCDGSTPPTPAVALFPFSVLISLLVLLLFVAFALLIIGALEHLFKGESTSIFAFISRHARTIPLRNSTRRSSETIFDRNLLKRREFGHETQTKMDLFPSHTLNLNGVFYTFWVLFHKSLDRKWLRGTPTIDWMNKNICNCTFNTENRLFKIKTKLTEMAKMSVGRRELSMSLSNTLLAEYSKLMNFSVLNYSWA